ncbi:MAG: hypothetical protein M3311_03785 [Thermoproteota archaeon]|nr:hypothetical protein [Thermoproteota archaeon]
MVNRAFYLRILCHYDMNVIVTPDNDEATILTAKTCGLPRKNAKVVYSFADHTNQISFLDKKDVTRNQLEACQRLLPYVSEIERGLVEKEILELKMVLDLMQ